MVSRTPQRKVLRMNYEKFIPFYLAKSGMVYFTEEFLTPPARHDQKTFNFMKT